MIASKGDPQMYNRRGKSTGWAAFDQQQRLKHIGDDRVTNDPFPTLSGTTTLFENPEKVSENKQLSVKPLSSVLVPPVNFIASAKENKKKQFEGVDSSGHRNFDTIFRWLKEQYSWADDSLIEDIMVAVDNDLDMASSFLKVMMSDNVLKDHKRQDFVSKGKAMPGKDEISVRSVQTVSVPLKTSSSMKVHADNGEEVGKSDFIVHDGTFSDNLIATNKMLGQLTCVPVEPEWEDDDVYFSCRKDAIKMMRNATRHSKAATNSFLRGDHYCAQQFSLKAQEEWESANRLNAKAAREILSIRNENNGIWRLDLHGLHASEAVRALQEHLHMIETQLYFKGSSSASLPNGSRTQEEALHGSSFNVANTKLKPVDQALSRPYLKWLEVITGIGNHSRGGAALPTAVRTFLVDNGYRIDEARPGVIMVRPKLRSSFMTAMADGRIAM